MPSLLQYMVGLFGFDSDLFRSDFIGFRQANRQYAVLELRFGLVCHDLRRQEDAPLESAPALFAQVVILLLGFILLLELALDGQYITSYQRAP